MAVVREGKSGNGRITLCESQDGCCQPYYNLTPSAPSNHSKFEGDGASNTRVYCEHTDRQFWLYIHNMWQISTDRNNALTSNGYRWPTVSHYYMYLYRLAFVFNEGQYFRRELAASTNQPQSFEHRPPVVASVS